MRIFNMEKIYITSMYSYYKISFKIRFKLTYCNIWMNVTNENVIS